MSKVVIQKFGGTSLQDESCRARAVHLVKQRSGEGCSAVVVVSAMGRMGAPYSTDSLLALARSCGGRLGEREHDLIASCGEIISAVVMAQSLVVEGLRAVPLTGFQAGIITDGRFGRSHVLRLDTGPLTRLINDGIVPVVAGFQGVSETGDITTLGRGGSDTSACVLGAALDASSIEIFTDVAGVMTADPRIVSNAKLIAEAHYSEVRALALKGGKVVHPRALETAAQARIPVVVRSTTDRSTGTIVHFTRNTSPVTGVASFSNITFFEITPSTKKKPFASSLHVFRLIAEAGISVHFIDVRPDEITFVVEFASTDLVKEILERHEFDFRTDPDFAKVSVVGVGMTGQPGMMATLVDTLTAHGIDIYQSTDSQTSISVLIRQRDERLALNCLHEAFGLDKRPPHDP